MQETKSAGFFIRLAATLLDILILLIPYALISLVIVILINLRIYSVEQVMAQEYYYKLFDYSYRIVFLYFCLDCESSPKYQGTLGKYLLKIKVVNEDGTHLSLVKAALRSALKMFSALLVGVGFFMILFTRKKLGLHDMICGTKVEKR